MSRTEENTGLCEAINNSVQTGGMRYEQAVNQNLSIISGVLIDISKSLAVIADAMKGETE